MITPESFLIGLQIALGVFSIVILYHLLFIVVDLRKIMRRLNTLTEEVEGVIMKPLSMVDSILEWGMETLEHQVGEGKKSKKKKKEKQKEKHEEA